VLREEKEYLSFRLMRFTAVSFSYAALCPENDLDILNFLKLQKKLQNCKSANIIYNFMRHFYIKLICSITFFGSFVSPRHRLNFGIELFGTFYLYLAVLQLILVV
jgi:hypothetical protein